MPFNVADFNILSSDNVGILTANEFTSNIAVINQVEKI